MAPYNLRLDWLLWFVAIPGWFGDRWLLALLPRLLESDRPTLKLLRSNPFGDRPPTFVRVSRYRYRFSSRGERRQDGLWWVRERVGEYLPPVALGPRAGQPGGPGRPIPWAE